MDYSLLSNLGKSLSVVDGDQEITIIGEFFNWKSGKRQQNECKATVPLEVVGIDIWYREGTSYIGSKYILVLIDQCTSNSFTYGM